VGCRRSPHLLQGFLDLVFAEIDLSGRCRRADVIRVERLGDRDKRDAVRIARDATCCARDARSDGAEIFSNDGGVRHPAALLAVGLERVEVTLRFLRIGA
jgi:hypothetical protein